MGLLRDRLVQSFEQHANRSAIWCNDATITYAELHERAQKFALTLYGQTDPNDAVGIYAQHDVDSLVGIVGTVLSGRSYVPLNPTFPLSRHLAICAQEPPRAILCAKRHEKKALTLMAELASDQALLNAEGDVIATGGQGSQMVPSQSKQRETVYSLFTSGTTGTPKGVRVLEANLLAYLEGIAPIADLSPEDKATHFFELSFDLSVHDIFLTFVSGAELNILPGKMKLAVGDFVKERQITKWFSVPSLASFCQRVGQLEPDSLTTLKTALFCGEALPVALAQTVSKAAPDARIWNLYGPTEATIAFTAKEYTSFADMSGEAVVPLGTPIGQQTCTIFEDAQEGELLLGGTQVTPGYIDNPSQTADRFFKTHEGTDTYRTGDLVVADDKHGFLFRGRLDDQVKINGFRIELLEVDRVIRNVSGAPEVATIVWPPQSQGSADHLIAFLVGSTMQQAELIALCRKDLPAYMIPRKFISLDQMPVSPSGKIDRKALTASLDV